MSLDYCKLAAIWSISVVPRSGTPFPGASVGVVMLSCFSQRIRAKTAITTFPIQARRQAICTILDNLSPLPIWAIKGRVSHLQIMCFSPLWRTRNNYVQFMSFHYWPRGKVSSKINWPTPHHSSLQLGRAYVFHRRHVNLAARNYLLECVSDEVRLCRYNYSFPFFLLWIHF